MKTKPEIPKTKAEFVAMLMRDYGHSLKLAEDCASIVAGYGAFPKEPEKREPDILEKLADLHKQATTENSHFYVAACVKEAIAEINRLREYEWMYKDLCK